MEDFTRRSRSVSAPGVDIFPSCDAIILMAPLDWARDKLERLLRFSTDPFTVSRPRTRG